MNREIQVIEAGTIVNENAIDENEKKISQVQIDKVSEVADQQNEA